MTDKNNNVDATEAIFRTRPIKTRHEARTVALQCLYAIELSQNRPDKAIIDIINDDDHESSADFARELVFTITRNRDTLNDEIEAKLKNWDFERVALIDRLILQLGICEFLFFENIPPKVTINEAVEIAKHFSTKKSGQFVNGVLDSIFYDLKKRDKILKRGRGLVET